MRSSPHSVSNHWAAELLGKPWVKGATGPDAFYCWGLVLYVYRTQLNVKLPLHQGLDLSNSIAVRNLIRLEVDPKLPWTRWFRIEPPHSPVEFDAVVMGVSKLDHVGLFTQSDGGLVVHAVDGQGVIAEKVTSLRSKYPRVEFYRYHHGPNR